VRSTELDSAIERYHAAGDEFVRGNPEPQKAAVSHGCEPRPIGLLARGWTETAKTMERANAQFADGEMVGFERLAECVTNELAYIVESSAGEQRSGAASRSPPENCG
jgi:hypothetical protein